MKTYKLTAVAVALSTLLAACGGGGGDSSTSGASTSAPVSTTPSTPVATAPVVTPGNSQTSVPALTYAQTSQEFAFVTAFNNFRQKLGLGLLAQNTNLDLSAQRHLQYYLTNDVSNGGTVDMYATDPASGSLMAHIETVGKPLFTGVSATDRAVAAGYNAPSVGEEIAFGGGKGGQIAFESLAGTLYHRAGLMAQAPTDIGAAVGTDASQTVDVEYGYAKSQSVGSDYVGVYPANLQTGIGLFARVEAPNPFPDLSTSNADFPTKTGYPVSVTAVEGATLEVVTFTLTESGASAPLDVRLLKADNDPNHYLKANTAFLVAKAPLKPNTTYSAAFSGRVNNVLVNKAWTFTTGS
jgi:uncharacterized protein YkwD